MGDKDNLQFESVEVRRFLTKTFNELFETTEYQGVNLKEAGWNWRFGRSTNTKSVGTAFHNEKMIVMWVWCFDEDCCSVEEAKDTFLHEMAHAFDVEIRGTSDHTKPWKDICIRIGAKPKATCSIKPPAKTYRWNAKCSHCHKIYIKSRTKQHPKKGEKLIHKECRDTLLTEGFDVNKVSEMLDTEWVKNF